MAKRRSTARFAGIFEPAPAAVGLRGGAGARTRRCAATSKASGYKERCGCVAMRGKQVCRVHGGKAGRKCKHGLYAFDMSRLGEEIQEKMQRHLANPDATNLRDEIALCRAFLENFVQVATPASSDHPPPLDSAFYDTLLSFASRLARLAKTQTEIQWGPQHLITATQAMVFFNSVMDAVFRHIKDVSTREAIVADLQRTTGLASVRQGTRLSLPASGHER